MSRNKREGKYAGFCNGHQRETIDSWARQQPCCADARFCYHCKLYATMKSFMQPL